MKMWLKILSVILVIAIAATAILLFTDEEKECCLCSSFRYHAPCLIDLETGDLIELDLYFPDDKLVAELESPQPEMGAIFSFVSLGNVSGTKLTDMHFWATQEEYDLIQKNMALSGSTNLSAFLRKMAIDGMVIRLDMPEIREMLHLLRRANANINQIARHLHDTGRIYDTDLEEILGFQKETTARLNDILTKLSTLK